ncbi:PQQ-binding-like beta-propeller repeat protein [Streptomyces sp. NPDC101152]|uniref:outer membrane protein assembly factor BamB family protein n=1 Tax=Streptomyces sp. NPDC101152 TaxID=3366116 RepID=UPI003823E2A9
MPQPPTPWTWRPDTPTHRMLSAQFRGGALVAVCDDDRHPGGAQVLALDPATSRTLWSRPLPRPASPLGGTAEIIAFLDHDRNLHGIRVSDGTPVWQLPGVIGPGRAAVDARQSAAISVSTAAPGGRLFTVTREWTRAYVSIDSYGGETRYEVAVVEDSGRVVVQRSDVPYYDDSWTRPHPEFSVGWRWIVARDPADGSRRWRSRTWRGAGEARLCVDRDAGLVIGVSGGGVRAFDVATGQPRWRRPAVRSRKGAPVKGFVHGAVLAGGVLCVRVSGTLAAFRAATGAPLWRRDLHGHGHELLVDGDTLYLLEHGPGPGAHLRALSAADGSVRWRYPAAGHTQLDLKQLLAVHAGLVHVTDSMGIRTLRATDGAVSPSASPRLTSGRPFPAHCDVGLTVFRETGRAAEPPGRLGRPFLHGLERAQRADGGEDGSFHVVHVGQRRIAVAEYGSRFYEEGTPVRFGVDLHTGAFQHWHANAVETRSWPPLSVGFLVPRWDPVRRWLAAGPRSEPTAVSIRTRGQLARFSAAEIVRRNLPGLAAAARLRASPLLALTSPRSRRLIGGDPAESLPYLVLFGSQTTAPTHIGTAQTRPTPETADLGDGA